MDLNQALTHSKSVTDSQKKAMTQSYIIFVLCILQEPVPNELESARTKFYVYYIRSKKTEKASTTKAKRMPHIDNHERFNLPKLTERIFGIRI